MTITQTVDIPELTSNRRLTIDVPREIPAGKTNVVIQFPVREEVKLSGYNTRDVELINLHAEQLNKEALDVLSFQELDI